MCVVPIQAWAVSMREAKQHVVACRGPVCILGMHVFSHATLLLYACGAHPGLGWFREAKQHVDEVELIGMFFAVEQQLQV